MRDVIAVQPDQNSSAARRVPWRRDPLTVTAALQAGRTVSANHSAITPTCCSHAMPCKPGSNSISCRQANLLRQPVPSIPATRTPTSTLNVHLPIHPQPKLMLSPLEQLPLEPLPHRMLHPKDATLAKHPAAQRAVVGFRLQPLTDWNERNACSTTRAC